MSQLDSLKMTQKSGLYEQKAESLRRFQNSESAVRARNRKLKSFPRFQNSDVRAENRKLKSFQKFQNSDVTVAEKRIRFSRF